MAIAVTTTWQEITITGKLLQNSGKTNLEVARSSEAVEGIRLGRNEILSGALWENATAYIRVASTSSSATGQAKLV